VPVRLRSRAGGRELGQRGPHALQISDLFVEPGGLRLRQSPNCVAIIRSAASEMEKFVDFAEAEAVFLGAFDEPDNFDNFDSFVRT